MKRSVQNLTHYNLFTADMGQLIPVACVPVLPGDTFRHNTSVMVRLSPMVAPVMHPLYVRIHHWFVPNRLLWDNWEDFITGGKDGLGVNTPVFPTITFNTVSKGSLMDYFGINPTSKSITVNALPFRAYNLIYNEYYRDQDLIDELDISLEDGEDDTTQIGLMNCAWSKDYFTTSRPTSQKGMEVTVPVSPAGDSQQEFFIFNLSFTPPNSMFNPLGASKDNLDNEIKNIMSEALQANPLNTGSTVGMSFSYTATSSVSASFNGVWKFSITGKSNQSGTAPSDSVFDVSSRLVSSTSYIIDSSTAVAYVQLADTSGQIFVNDLRLAMALQRFEEQASRWGSRYVDYLRNLGVHSSDSRLQRPEYLGGGRFQINTSEVLQTANGDDGTGVGNMYGHGLALGRSNRYIRFFEEHGYVITLFSVLPINIYGNGLKRDWLKRTMLDFWHPTIQNLGQQEVYQKELWQDTAVSQELPFGYQDRFDEYRFEWSQIHGDFRDTLSDWHFARIFEEQPVLNGTFVTANPTKRPFASQKTNVLWCAAWNSIKARRLLSAVAKPKIM